MSACARVGCMREATTAMGVDIFPHKAVMEHYKTNAPLTRFYIGLEVCDEHFDDTKPEDVIKPEDIEQFVVMCEKQSGTVVDRAATRLVRVSMDDPHYLTLLKQRQPA